MTKISFRKFSEDHNSPQWLCYYSLFILLLLSAGYRLAFVLFLTLAVLLLFNFIYLRSLAYGLKLKLDPVQAIREQDFAQLKFYLTNDSAFSIHNLIFLFHFSGSSKSNYATDLLKPIPRNETALLPFSLHCDVGMGTHEVNECRIIIADLFNIFCFDIHFENTVEVEVRPRIEPLPKLQTRGSKYSQLYGPEEVMTRGLSVNFSGVRPFNLGDSIRHIAWRPTARHGQLIVKEFEKMVSTDATFVLNLNPHHHLGVAKFNSWILAKEITLSLVSQLLEQRNSVEFLYNYGILEKSNSPEQFYMISRALVAHDMYKSALGDHLGKIYTDDPLMNWISRVNHGSTMIYVGTIHYYYLQGISESLKWLARENIEVILVLINPLMIWPEFKFLFPQDQDVQKTNKLADLLSELKLNGIRILTYDMAENQSVNLKELSVVKQMKEKLKQNQRKENNVFG